MSGAPSSGVSVRGKFVLSRNPGFGLCFGVEVLNFATGEPGKVQGLDRVGIVEGSCGNWARGVNIRGKFVLSTNPGTRRRWGRQMAKRSSDPG